MTLISIVESIVCDYFAGFLFVHFESTIFSFLFFSAVAVIVRTTRTLHEASGKNNVIWRNSITRTRTTLPFVETRQTESRVLRCAQKSTVLSQINDRKKHPTSLLLSLRLAFLPTKILSRSDNLNQSITHRIPNISHHPPILSIDIMKTNMISLAQRSLRVCGSMPSRQTSRTAKLQVDIQKLAEKSPASQSHRFFSSQQLPPDDPQAQFRPTAPTELNMEMAQGIQTANHLILKHGVGRQRLELLSKASDDSMPLVVKWQRMMEIYLGAQLHVVASLGYQTDETGIMTYTQQLAQFVGTKCDPMTQDEFRAKGRDTWRDMLTIAFDLDKDMIAEKYSNELSIVDARNIVHKVASALIEPEILEEVALRVSCLVRLFNCSFGALTRKI